MGDGESAVLVCLAWQAARQGRLRRGRHAGRFVARLSGAQLAKMSGRCLRTVRHVLRALRRAGRIVQEDQGPGRTALYRLDWIEPGQS
jgi:hypothetical protein